MKKRPNIIFIMTDQQRFDTLGKAFPKTITPNLDRLIEDSVSFTAHAPCCRHTD